MPVQAAPHPKLHVQIVCLLKQKRKTSKEKMCFNRIACKKRWTFCVAMMLMMLTIMISYYTYYIVQAYNLPAGRLNGVSSMLIV